jgi:hypothetical protein
MNPVHTFPPYFLKIGFNIIIPSMTRSSEWSLPLRLPDQNFVRISSTSVLILYFHVRQAEVGVTDCFPDTIHLDQSSCVTGSGRSVLIRPGEAIDGSVSFPKRLDRFE